MICPARYSCSVPAAIPNDALCLDCNYSLRGLAEFRCPECGRPFDPDRPLSMNLGRPLHTMPRWALRPIGRWAAAWMYLAAAFGVLGPAWLAPSRWLTIYFLLLWAGFFVACWLRHLVRRSVVLGYRQPAELLLVDRRFDRRSRVVFAVVLLLVLSRIPFILAAFVSKPWLDRFAYYLWAERPVSFPDPQGPMVRGLLVIERVDASPTRVTLYFPGGSSVYYERDASGEALTPNFFPRWKKE